MVRSYRGDRAKVVVRTLRPRGDRGPAAPAAPGATSDLTSGTRLKPADIFKDQGVFFRFLQIKSF